MIVVIALVMVLLGFMEGSYGSGLKFRWWTELLVFLLFGPVFTSGFQLGIGLSVDFESLFLGVVSGWLAAFVIHIRNFEAIMVNDQAGISNSVQSLGFESSKKLLRFWWVCLVLLMDAYHWFFAHDVWLVAFVLISMALSLLMFKVIRSIQSPVSSKYRPALAHTYRLTLVLMALWGVENLSYLIWKEIG